jgi:hypothetical protein
VAPEFTVHDPDSTAFVRTGPCLFIAADPRRGTLYLTRLNHQPGTLEGVEPALSVSTDGGVTWSSEIRPNQTPPGINAWPSALAVTRAGTVGLVYYDLRANTPDPATLPVQPFLATCRHDCADPARWSERSLTAPFDLATAPKARGFMLGDHTGLDTVGDLFVPLLTKTNAGDMDNRTDIFLVVDLQASDLK